MAPRGQKWGEDAEFGMTSHIYRSAGLSGSQEGFWDSAKELGYQECRKKQALCQDGGVKPQAAEQSQRVERQEASPSECQAGRHRGDKK